MFMSPEMLHSQRREGQFCIREKDLVLKPSTTLDKLVELLHLYYDTTNGRTRSLRQTRRRQGDSRDDVGTLVKVRLYDFLRQVHFLCHSRVGSVFVSPRSFWGGRSVGRQLVSTYSFEVVCTLTRYGLLVEVVERFEQTNYNIR